ncbi:MAG TPA: hypothetical protein VF503_01375 [Sphingobium sp.]|uniref:hypothetical protein n=1 Tax=Sphingobium sp. TaxID=1912891 RepID=UPI002ED68BD4
MAKALKTVAMVVAAVALVATGVGIALGGLAAAGSAAAATAGSFLTISAATWMTIGTVAGLAAGIMSMGAGLLAPKPSFSGGGNPQQFQTNPQAGLPYAIGRTALSGTKVRGVTSRSYNTSQFDDILHFVVLLAACGQIGGIEQFTADQEVVTFDWTSSQPYGNIGTGQANGGFNNYMSQRVSLGKPGDSSQKVGLVGQDIPGWSDDHKLGGMAFATWQLRYDSNGGYYSGGVPTPRWVGTWARVYDPRLDSTYPGGSGPCRVLDETTYVDSSNPYLHALTWTIGRFQNGKKTQGIGAPLRMIRIADFVEGANVADANGWRIGGVVYSTDAKWGVLKSMLQAGGGVPTQTAAMIGCRVNKPRVSIQTITSADLLDSLAIPSTKSRRDRINTIRPRYRSESNDWEVVTGSAISVPAYIAADGAERSKELDLPLVQQEVGQGSFNGAQQAGELAMYEIVNAREAGPITFITGPKFIGLRNGDCITLHVPEEGLSNQKVLLTSDPVFDPATGKFRFTCETETDAKHAFALGASSTPPPAWSPTPPDTIPPKPEAADWTLSTAVGTDGLPYLQVHGLAATTLWRSVLVSYRKVGSASWTFWGEITDRTSQRAAITGIDGAANYEVQIAYTGPLATGNEWLNLGNVVTAVSSISTARAQADAAAAAANAAAGNASVALGQIGAIVADNILDRSEKPAVVAQWQAISDEQGVLDARAVAFGITTERSTYDSAISALAAYLNSLSPAWSDYSQDSAIVRATFNGRFTDVYYARQLLLDRVAAVAKARADQGVANAATAQDAANAAQLTASGAQGAAAAAASNAAAALGQIGTIVADGILDRSEKPAVVAQWQAIYDEQGILDARAAAFGITSQRTTYDNAIAALATYLNSLTPAWYDYGQDTGIVRSTFNGRFTDVYYARQALADAIAYVAAQRANWSDVGGSGKPQDNATVGSPSGTNVGGKPADDVASTVKAGGGVAPNNVDTAAIQDNAVSTGVTYFNKSHVSTYPTSGNANDTVFAQVTITTSGKSVSINLSAWIGASYGAGQTSYVVIYRDGVGGNLSSPFYVIDVYTSQINGAFTYFFTDTACPAGTHTYYFTFQGAYAFSDIYNRMAEVRESKK